MPTPTLRDVPPLPTGLLCPVCGKPLPAPTGRAGRPPDTCSEPCRTAWRLLRDAEIAIGVVQDRASPRAWLRLRARLWRTMNDRAWNRGVVITRASPP